MSKTIATTMDKIVALCRRRGFIFGSSEIYGGIGGFWDYGPLGCELKRNIKDAWWNDMVRNPPLGPGGVEYQMVGVDCSIIMNPKVWEASGHVGGFADPMVDCKECKKRFRADKVWFVTVWPKGAIENRDDVEQSGASARVCSGSSMVTCAAMEVDIGSPTSQAVEVVRSIARVRNLKQLRHFSEFGYEQRFDGNRLYFRAHLAEPDEYGLADEHDYECILEPSMGAAYALEYRPCPACHVVDSLTEPRAFNLMFQTHVGALQDESSVAYLRPETAQGIFANFQNVMDSSRVKIPFGIAQIGKAFRNEINPRNYTFRSREFEQMEIEFFCKPDELCRSGEVTSLQWYEFWRDARIGWYTSLGIKSDKLRPRQQGKDELAHYSSACTDIEYLFPFSDEPQELEGVAHRGCFDLSQHGKHARGKEDAFAVLDDEPSRDREGAVEASAKAKPVRYVPHVIEPSAGADRFTLAVICEAYSFDENRASPEFMKFHPRLAPIKAAVFPLVAKDGMPEIAEPIYREIKKHMPAQYDAKQSIGKRYARMDEAGTPFCFTIDGQTKDDGTVTVRNRDDASQIRIDKSRCLEFLREKLGL